MKYEKEVDQMLFKTLPREGWITKQMLSDQIQAGVDNGMSVETQLRLC